MLLFCAGAAEANIIMAENDWDTTPAGGVGNWSPRGTSASVIENTSDASSDFLEIDFPGGIASGSGDQWHETVSTPSDDLFAGTWQTDFWIEFDFWAKDTQPDTLQIRWHGTANDNVYGYGVSPTAAVGDWQTLKTATFSSVDDWRLGPGVTQSDFLADLDSIDWIGVYFFRNGTDAEVYGIDDFKLMVPEPSQYIMLGFALLTALLVRRRP